MWCYRAPLCCPVTRSCAQLCDPVDCGHPVSFVHGIFQERILDRVAISSSRTSSQPKDRTCVSCISSIGRQILYHCTTWDSLIAQMVRICWQCRRPKLYPWVRKTPWRGEWPATSVFLPGEFHGQTMVSQRVGHDWAANTFTFSLPVSHLGSKKKIFFWKRKYKKQIKLIKNNTQSERLKIWLIIPHYKALLKWSHYFYDFWFLFDLLLYMCFFVMTLKRNFGVWNHTNYFYSFSHKLLTNLWLITSMQR